MWQLAFEPCKDVAGLGISFFQTTWFAFDLWVPLFTWRLLTLRMARCRHLGKIPKSIYGSLGHRVGYSQNQIFSKQFGSQVETFGYDRISSFSVFLPPTVVHSQGFSTRAWNWLKKGRCFHPFQLPFPLKNLRVLEVYIARVCSTIDFAAAAARWPKLGGILQISLCGIGFRKFQGNLWNWNLMRTADILWFFESHCIKETSQRFCGSQELVCRLPLRVEKHVANQPLKVSVDLCGLDSNSTRAFSPRDLIDTCWNFSETMQYIVHEGLTSQTR